MTLCVGWIDSEAAYLTADSAVTKPPRDLNNEYSTFGEKQPQTAAFTVEESALKIYRHKDSAAAFAGDPSPINDLFFNYINASRFLSPREAFNNAWTSSHDGRDLEALFAFHDGAGPHLVKYDAANIAGAEVTSACIGNLFVGDKEYIRSVLQRMPHKADVTDRLVCGVCISQRLAILANVMETHGIGGVVAGCSVSKEGLRWSPDTLHVILRGQMPDQRSDDLLATILTCTRFDILFVRNNLSAGYNCFATGFGANTGLGRREVVEKILANQESLPSLHTDLEVEYIVFHDVLTQLSTVFDVRTGAHPNLKYWMQQDDGRLNFRFTATGNGFGALRRSSAQGGDIAFVPHNYS
jgi:hypothetical protein